MVNLLELLFMLTLFISIFILFLACSFSFLQYFFLAVPMCLTWRQHFCTSFTLSITRLNGTCFFSCPGLWD